MGKQCLTYRWRAKMIDDLAGSVIPGACAEMLAGPGKTPV
jgi:hypothetical protein